MKKLLTTLLLLLITTMAFSEIQLVSSTTTPKKNERFKIVVRFINEGKKDYVIEGIENLEILSKGRSSSTSIINGDKKSEIMEVYDVILTGEKDFTLVLKIDGKIVNEIPLSIDTSAGNSAIISNNDNISQNKVDIQNSNNSTNKNIDNQKNNLRLITNLDNKTYYFGEKILYREVIETNMTLDDVDYMKYPEFYKLSSIPITDRQEKTTIYQGKNGENIISIPGYKAIITPTSSGEFDVKKSIYSAILSSGDRYGFMNSSNVKYLGGDIVKLKVLPLPHTENKNFKNIVGTPQLKYSFNKKTLDNSEDGLTLNVKIFGNVNLDGLDKIVNLNSGNSENFNIFENLKNSNEDIKNNGYYAIKEFEIALFPKKTGEIFTPEIKIPYFNTKTKKYEDLIIPSEQIYVFGNKNSDATSSTNNDINSENTEKVVISTINDSSKGDSNIKIIEKNSNYTIITLSTISLIEFLIILYLLFRNKKGNKKFLELEKLKKAKDDKEFYEFYCQLMKEKFNFNPKVELSTKLSRLGFDSEFIVMNEELESNCYNNTPIDRELVIKKLKEVLKNEK